MRKKISFYTLGCRLNFSETAEMAGILANKGYEIVPFGDNAHVTVVNTCTVTKKADATCRNLIRKAHGLSPQGKIIVAGCYAQMDSERLSKMPEVDLVLGTSEKYNILAHLNAGPSQGPIHVKKTRNFQSAISGPLEGRTRSFLKIQDGCNYICSFCIIPQARGPSRSISIREALLRIKTLAKNSLEEVVLTGVNIGEYKRHRGESLCSLIKEILKMERPTRLRLSSVEPNTITEELLNILSSSKKFMPHFHIPLQSGNDNILKKMRRRYNVEEYKRIAWRIKEILPHASIGADIICGFPGENDQQFNDTYNLVKYTPLTHLHVFPYSLRKGTAASHMDDQVQEDVKKSRVKRLLALGEEKIYNLMNQHISQTSEVLFENRDDRGRWWGYTPNYLKTYVFSKENLHNKILKVRHQDIQRGSLKSVVLKNIEK